MQEGNASAEARKVGSDLNDEKLVGGHSTLASEPGVGAIDEDLPPGVENMYRLGSALAFDIVTEYAFGRYVGPRIFPS